jgi:hypothetical protein
VMMKSRIALVCLMVGSAVLGRPGPADAAISVEILRPTSDEKVLLSGTITFKGVVHIPDHPEKESEAIIVWQLPIEGRTIMATTKSGEEKTYTLDIPFPTQNSSFGPIKVTAVVNEFQVVGNDEYTGDGALKVIVLEETGENYEGWVVNSTDPSEQDMVIGQNTEDLEGCTYYIEGYCIHPDKDVPSYGLIFLQPWTSDSEDHWAYWVKKAIRYANAHGYDEYDKLDAGWYIVDRDGYPNQLLFEIGYDPYTGPTRHWETDLTPPSTPEVIDDGDTTPFRDRLHARWLAYDAESGVIKCRYAVGTTSGGTNVVDWTEIEATDVTVTGLSLTDGEDYYFAVKAMNEAGLWSGIGTSDGITVTAGQGEFGDETVFTYPNPFNPDEEVANIDFQVSGETAVTIEIFDAAGDLVWKQELVASGAQSVTWNGRNMGDRMVSNGVYIYRVTANGESVVKKIAVLR